MQTVSRKYLPAAGKGWLLPFYDPMVKLLGGEAARRALLEQAALGPGHRVLDLGCGTGTFAVTIKRLYPQVEVIGVDPDPKALVRARAKAARAAVAVQFDQGFGDELPYPDASFDRVVSSFVFHHIPADEKGAMLRAVRRVLKPGATLHLLDLEGPADHAHGILAHLFHDNRRLQDNSEGRVVSRFQEAGFGDAQKVSRRRMLFGGVAYYRAA